ncbi:MAG TPA: hypothetical protein VGM81_22900 [Burkholderiaceae bacterium]|jgi:hypothetical protein
MSIRSIVALALFGALAVPACAQQMYKCGSTYSQTPCASDAELKRARPDAVADKPASVGPIGYELCASSAPHMVGSPEPESARVQRMGEVHTDVINYAGKSVAARRYDLSVDFKTTYGVYSGPRAYSCWISEDERRVLQFAPRR